MKFLTGLLSTIIGGVSLIIFYEYFDLPILPAVSVHITQEIFNKNEYGRTIPIILVTLFGILIYGISIYTSIINYPQYLNILGIILHSSTILAIIGAGISKVLINISYKSKKQ